LRGWVGWHKNTPLKRGGEKSHVGGGRLVRNEEKKGRRRVGGQWSGYISIGKQRVSCGMSRTRKHGRPRERNKDAPAGQGDMEGAGKNSITYSVKREA